jgi:tetratricopeptide (TPR) repeat protein
MKQVKEKYPLLLENVKEGEGEEINACKQAIKTDPDYADAHYNLACSYSLLGDVNKALESLGRSIDLGFDDIKHIENDSDLNGLRDEAGYKKLINKLKS